MPGFALPLLFVNLGGEMVYIIGQRLDAQSIAADKSDKVMHDIIGTMFNSEFVEELFKPQKLYTRAACFAIFERLAHTSIMRLNPTSMEKLFDLMTMSVKYQLINCTQPAELILITLNHLDGIRSYIHWHAVAQLVEAVYARFISLYTTLSIGEFRQVRNSLLGFFQDNLVKVSVFIKENVQLPDGHFAITCQGHVPCGFEIPGLIKQYDDKGSVISTTDFQLYDFCNGEDPEQYLEPFVPGSVELYGNRVTKLGINIFTNGLAPIEQATNQELMKKDTLAQPQPVDPLQSPQEPYAKQEVNVLAKMIRPSEKCDDSLGFSLQILELDFEESGEVDVVEEKEKIKSAGGRTFECSASVKRDEGLLAILREFDLSEKSEEESGEPSLLDMLDSVAE